MLPLFKSLKFEPLNRYRNLWYRHSNDAVLLNSRSLNRQHLFHKFEFKHPVFHADKIIYIVLYIFGSKKNQGQLPQTRNLRKLFNRRYKGVFVGVQHATARKHVLQISIFNLPICVSSAPADFTRHTHFTSVSCRSTPPFLLFKYLSASKLCKFKLTH